MKSSYAYWHFSTAQRGNKSPCRLRIRNYDIYGYETSLKHTIAFLNWELWKWTVHSYSQDEIEAMFNKVFATDRLDQVKDIFLFSCFTGLAYVDVNKLSRKNRGFGVYGERWIFYQPNKDGHKIQHSVVTHCFRIIGKIHRSPTGYQRGKTFTYPEQSENELLPEGDSRRL